MVNGIQHAPPTPLGVAFNLGFSNAARALSSMLNQEANYYPSVYHVQKLDSGFFTKNDTSIRFGGHMVTTEIFGEVKGKSYLILSESEFTYLTHHITNNNFKEEFIKELDNILSASVITHLSNQLKLKIYGDIPTFVGKVNSQIEHIIHDDFGDEFDQVCIYASQFTIEGKPDCTPQFIWALDSQVLEYITAEAG